MKIVLDHGTPRQLAAYLIGHEVKTCAKLAWNELRNGELIAAAEETGFHLMISSDQISNISRTALTENWP